MERTRHIVYSENVNPADISEETIHGIAKEKKRQFCCQLLNTVYQSGSVIKALLSSSSKVTSTHPFVNQVFFELNLNSDVSFLVLYSVKTIEFI